MKKKNTILIGFICAAVLLILSWIYWPVSNLSWAQKAVGSSVIYTMSKSEIDRRLGQPDDPTGYFNVWDHVYFLQPDGSYIDSWWLLIAVDENGKIIRADVVTD